MPPKRKLARSPSPLARKRQAKTKTNIRDSHDGSDGSLDPEGSFDDDDDEGVRGETLRELSRLENEARERIATHTTDDTMERISAALDGISNTRDTQTLRRLFETRVNIFEDLVTSVSTSGASSRAALEGAFAGAMTYYAETRPRQTAQAGEDAKAMVLRAVEKANDGDAYHEAKDMIRAMRKLAQATSGHGRRRSD